MGFNHWEAYMKWRIKPNSRRQLRRQWHKARGGWSSSDPRVEQRWTCANWLDRSVEVSQPTPQRPIGAKSEKIAAKGKGKTQGSASQSIDIDGDGDTRVSGYAQLHKLTHSSAPDRSEIGEDSGEGEGEYTEEHLPIDWHWRGWWYKSCRLRSAAQVLQVVPRWTRRSG